jgi:hypothetical protein
MTEPKKPTPKEQNLSATPDSKESWQRSLSYKQEFSSSRRLRIANSQKLAAAAARQLQKDLFNQYSETYKVLEFGWNPEAYILTPSVIAAMMQDIESRRSHKNKIIELISSDEDRDAGCAETLSQQISRRILESQGFNALDM